ncbi:MULTISPECIES: copper homeostasis protein CutC [unclassified Photobacterium]|uniref:copper homeostasis protein CutC n=1 Tax=unclassified Photobacterium TaxID=2628852 RepID=UPI001EDFE7E8|nr:MULTISPECIES: copper homeostasis protein CutC [unclassified Photobacterium]MCG3863175.1 copper homeostasis protein CutC [Photobacterium sp. Ph6]MCG3874705.1 copper homeostasis protein CutC [Photobacterium sp. Ph5]
MSIQLEVCIDNLESLHYAQQGGATRIELCSSLALGGLTPSAGLMQLAAKQATIPVYAMIRPRQGDFLFSSDDVEIMLADIYAAHQAGLQGIVIGALTEQSLIDSTTIASLIKQAKGLGVTFHRAIDQCVDPFAALDTIMSYGCERILTSGLQPTAPEGTAMIKNMVNYCGDRISIMAGAGVTPKNVQALVAETGIKEVHLSGKTTRPSKILNRTSSAHMGNAIFDDFQIPVTNIDTIQAVAQRLKR